MANESTVAGQGPLLGWNKAQDAISALAHNIESLNKGLTTATGKIKQFGGGTAGFWSGLHGNQGSGSGAQGYGYHVNQVWNGSSNYGHGNPNGGSGAPSTRPTVQAGQSGGRTANGGGATFSNNGSQGGGAANNGGTGGGSGGTTSNGSQGGGGANNGGRRSYSLKGGLTNVVAWGQKKLPDQVVMQTSAYQAAQGSSASWHTVRDQAFKNNYTAQSTQDAAMAYGSLAQSGLSAGTANFNSNWNYVKSSGYVNPGMSQAQRAAGAAAAWNAPSYYGAQMIGVQTIKSGKKQSPRQIAQQLFKQFNLDRIKDPKQIAGTIDNPNSGLMMTLSATFDANTVKDVQAELKGMALAQTHGGSATAYVSTANKAANGNKDAISKLNDWNIGGSTAQTVMDRAGTLRNQDVNENDAFTAGLKDATSALDTFSTGLQNVLKTLHISDAMGYGGGAASLVGSSIGTGIGAYGTMRGLSMAGRLFGMGGAAAGAGGAGAGGAGAAGAGGAAAGATGAGAFTSLASAALVLAPFLGAGYAASKHNRDHKTITGASTKGMGFTGWVKDTFSWTAIKRNLNPFYVLGDKNKSGDGQSGGAGGGSGSAASAGAGSSHSAVTGSTGAGKTAAAVIKVAMKYLGTPYKWGGADPKSGFDCSGLLQYSFRQIGVSLPRVASQQQKAGKPVKLANVRAGDLLFNGNPAHHVVMCIGNGKIIEAPHTGANVRIRSFRPGEFTNAVRILGAVGNLGDLSDGDSEDQAGSRDSRLSTMGFGGDVGAYGSVEEVDAIAAGVSAIGAASVGSGVGAGQGSKGSSDNGAASGALPKGNVATWIKKALGIINQDSNANERIVNTMIQHESGGNPRAINNWDSNAKAGHPSKGIMQTIDSTFNHYSIKGHKDIWNPVDNIIAGVRYADSRYGSLANVPGIKSMNNGGGYKGYAVGSSNIDVDQTARVHKGEMIIPAYQAEAVRNALAGNTPLSSGVGGLRGKSGPVTLQFNSGAITVKVQGAMDSQSARDAAKQFMTAIAEDDRINLIAAGN
jgi:cell wall-associated NlpC family hydrolase